MTCCIFDLLCERSRGCAGLDAKTLRGFYTKEVTQGRGDVRIIAQSERMRITSLVLRVAGSPA
jgi:hypothetical protein